MESTALSYGGVLDSYRNAMVLSLTKQIALDRIRTHTNVLAQFASTSHVLLMNGYEQVPWPDDVLPIIEEFNQSQNMGIRCLQSNPPEFVQSIRRQNPDLPRLQGYFYSGRLMPILKGVFSSRSCLKGMNNECQRELVRWAEPFSTIAWVFGSEYPGRTMMRTWKTLLLNHTHDDVCGCSIDSIARDMQARFARVRQTSFDLTQRAFRNIVQDSQGNQIPYQMVTRMEDRTDLYLFAIQIPSLGYKTYYIIPDEVSIIQAQTISASEDDRSMENDFLRVTINPNGSLNIICKVTGQEYSGLGYFEDGGDCGDTYDYSYPREDQIISSLNQAAKISLVESGPYLARFRVELNLQLPKSLAPDRTTRNSETICYPLVTFVELAADSRRVEVQTHVRNTAKDHRLRILFPTDVQTDHSYVEAPFDVATFPIDTTQHPAGEKSEKLRDLMIAGHDTSPAHTHIMQNFVGLADGIRGLTIASHKLGEYEILKAHTTVALTLIRSVGWLARQDLLTRVGDVGPHIFTPEAQEIGDQVFTYSIYPNTGDWLRDKPHFMSDNQNMKFRAVQTDIHSGELPEDYSFFSWETEDQMVAMRMTSIKRSERRDGVIIRFYNTTDDAVKGRLIVNGEVLNAYRTNLNEEEEFQLPLEENRITVEARGHEIITIKIIMEHQAHLYRRATETTKVLPSLTIDPALPEVELPPVITFEEVEAERKRSRQLQQNLRDLRNQAYQMEDEIEREAQKDLRKLAELQNTKTQVATLTRQHYESRVSVLENERLYWMYKLESELGEIGEELNWARTKKRVFEYLSNYYEIRLQHLESAP
ncbi:MAG: glycoside hydrolase family 38 C-terminal domain-containing protein [Calditrichota bacterium]